MTDTELQSAFSFGPGAGDTLFRATLQLLDEGLESDLAQALHPDCQGESRAHAAGRADATQAFKAKLLDLRHHARPD